MMLTKEEAKEVWCPMVRVGVMASAGGPSAVNDPTVEFRGNCIADKCAMWRWAAVDVCDPLDPAPPALGYCGLAGKPYGAL